MSISRPGADTQITDLHHTYHLFPGKGHTLGCATQGLIWLATPLVFALLSFASIPPCQAGVDLFVSQAGDDSNDGSRATPFRTIEHARDAIRDLKQQGPLPEGGITVWIREGDYFLRQTFELTEMDSGTARSPILYRAYEEESVRLIGGRRIQGFTPVTDPSVRERLDRTACARVLQTSLFAQGIHDLGHMEAGGSIPLQRAPVTHAWPSMEIFYHNKSMVLARWPNHDWGRIDQLYPPNLGVVAEKHKGDYKPEDRVMFSVTTDRLGLWAAEPDLWLHGYFRQTYHEWYLQAANIYPATGIFDLGPARDYLPDGLLRGGRFEVLNALCELDLAGEYWIDHGSGLLYFLPPEPIDKIPPIVSTLNNVIRMREVDHVTIRGLTVEVCRGAGIVIEGGFENRIVGCTIRNTGHTGIHIEGGEGHEVRGCDLYDVGYHGIFARGGNHATLTPARHLVENCHITRVGRLHPAYSAAIWFRGVGLTGRHNLIHDIVSLALCSDGLEQDGQGNEIAWELNEVSNASFQTWDSAYVSGNHSIIRNNFFHHLYAGNAWTRMVYIDWGIGNTLVEGNVFYRAVGGQAVMIGGSRYNRVENNIFVDCAPALWIDCRDGPVWNAGPFMERNNYREPPWSVKYPHLVNATDDRPFGQGGCPLHSTVKRNICLGRWDDDVEDAAREVVEWKDNFVTDSDPGFLDYQHMDFQITDTALLQLKERIGFKPIPFDKIGCYQSDERASWPVPMRHKPTMFHPEPVEVRFAPNPIIVDGSASDWASIAPAPSRHQLEGGSFYLAWREEGLYGMAKVHDGNLKINPGIPWGNAISGPGDCIQILIQHDCAKSLKVTEKSLRFALNIRPDLGVFGSPAQITYWKQGDPNIADQEPTVAWIGDDGGGIVAAWKPFPEGYLHADSTRGYVIEYFVPAERLALAGMKSGAIIGFSTRLYDDQMVVEELHNPEHPGTIPDIPQTWGRIGLTR